MTRTRLPRLVHGRWAWITTVTAAIAATLLAVGRRVYDRDQAEGKATGTEPARETADAAGVGTRLRQARMDANARIRAAGRAVLERVRSRGTPSEPDAAETTLPPAGSPEAAAPEHDNNTDGGNGRPQQRNSLEA